MNVCYFLSYSYILQMFYFNFEDIGFRIVSVNEKFKLVVFGKILKAIYFLSTMYVRLRGDVF